MDITIFTGALYISHSYLSGHCLLWLITGRVFQMNHLLLCKGVGGNKPR